MQAPVSTHTPVPPSWYPAWQAPAVDVWLPVPVLVELAVPVPGWLLVPVEVWALVPVEVWALVPVATRPPPPSGRPPWREPKSREQDATSIKANEDKTK